MVQRRAASPRSASLDRSTLDGKREVLGIASARARTGPSDFISARGGGAVLAERRLVMEADQGLGARSATGHGGAAALQDRTSPAQPAHRVPKSAALVTTTVRTASSSPRRRRCSPHARVVEQLDFPAACGDARRGGAPRSWRSRPRRSRRKQAVERPAGAPRPRPPAHRRPSSPTVPLVRRGAVLASSTTVGGRGAT